MEQWENSELCFPQLSNASCWKPRRSHSEALISSILLSLISVLTVFLNLLVIIAISHFKQLHTPTNLLLLSLAVSDFLVGALMSFHVLFVDGCWLLGNMVCVLYQYLAYIITSSSLGTMVLISVDRYLAICDPMLYSTRVTLQKVRICVTLCWLLSWAFQSITLSENLKAPGRYNSCVGECVIAIDYIVGLVDLVVTFIAPITAIVVLYIRVFVVALSHARAIRSRIVAAAPRGAKRSEVKAALSLGVVVLVFLICICPYFCVALLGEDVPLDASSSAFVIFLVYFNSCLNPLIYAFFYPWFRRSVKLIVTLKVLQRDSRQTKLL